MDSEHAAWLKRSTHRESIARVLRKPLTAREICDLSRKHHNVAIDIRDIWTHMRQFSYLGLAFCLNPGSQGPRLHFFTDQGRDAARKAFSAEIPVLSPGIDWHAYAQVVLTLARRPILLALADHATDNDSGLPASQIRRSLLDRHPLCFGTTLRALASLRTLGLVRPSGTTKRQNRRLYLPTEIGLRIADELRR